jgi:cell division protein FtsN
MDAGIIVAIVVAVVVAIVLVAVVLPRARRAKAERQLNTRRERVADRHREAADTRRVRADVAEKEARHARAEAELHESRAELHDRGLADDELQEAERGEPRRTERREDARPGGRERVRTERDR